MFINIPENYLSTWSPLIYHYQIEEPKDLLLEVINSDTNEIIVVKKFYSTNDIKIDISHTIRQKIATLPKVGPTGFAVAESGFIRVRLRIDGQMSADRAFTLSRQKAEIPSILTTMPNARVLSPGENDTLFITTELGEFTKVNLLATPRNQEEYNPQQNSFVTTSRADEFNIFTINADEYNVNYQSIDVTINPGKVNQSKVFYHLSPPDETMPGYRVAWLSTKGSIERYTFPVVESAKRLKSGAFHYSLRSAYGTTREVEALSEIVSSSKVWHITPSGEAREIEVTTTESPLFSEGCLTVANIEIEEYDKGFN